MTLQTTRSRVPRPRWAPASGRFPRHTLAWGMLWALWVLLPSAVGWRYYPFRDDWAWFGRPNFEPAGRWGFYLAYHLDAYRPLSFLLDTQVWARFWPHLTPVSAIMAGLAFLTAFVFQKAFHHVFSAPMWSVPVALLWWPLLIEGQYWLAAAAAMVPALLLLAVGVTWTVRSHRGATPSAAVGWRVAAAAAFLASDLCYEQQWMPGLLVMIAVAAKAPRGRKWADLLTAVVPLGLTATWYLAHAAGVTADGKRPVASLSAVLHAATATGAQMGQLFGPVMIRAFGQAVQWPTPLSWALAGIILAGGMVVALAVWPSYRRDEPSGAEPPLRLALYGLAWIGASYSPWLLTRYFWVADRSVYVAAPGIGLVLEAVIILLTRAFHRTPWRWTIPIGAGLALAAMMSLHVQDLWAYRQANRFDQALGRMTLAALHRARIPPRSPVLVVADTKTFVPWADPYHDFVSTAWSVPWGVHLMWFDLSRGRDDYPVTMVWRGQPVAAPAAYQVVLTTHVPSPARCPLTGVPCLVLQYHDPWPGPGLRAIGQYRPSPGR